MHVALRFAHTAIPLSTHPCSHMRPFVHTSPAPLFTPLPPFCSHTCVALAHAHFVRRYAHFESTIPSSPPIHPHESTLIDTSLTFDDQHCDAKTLLALAGEARLARAKAALAWQRIPNTIASPVVYYQKIDDDSSAWGKAVATVDASHTRVFSCIWNQHTYEHMNRHADKEGPGALNKVVFPPDSHSMLRALVLNFGLAVSARVFSTWLVWRQEPDKSFTVAFAPMGDYKQFNGSTAEIMNALKNNTVAAQAVRGTVKGFWRIKPLAPEGKQAAELAAEKAREQRARPPA